MNAAGRYAIYFAPARRSAWWEFGAVWLGRDDATRESLQQPIVPGFPAAEFAALTEEPRRYGFHATLKAPMRLRGASETQLLAQVDALAAMLRAVPLGPLAPAFLDGFVALVPPPSAAVDEIAASCVCELDDLRAPPDEAQTARRNPRRLDGRGRELLARWGYPHVMERFRFHMTVTGPVAAPVAQRFIDHLQPVVARLNRQQPLVLDRLCVFHEPAPGAPLRRIHDAPLPA